MQNLLYYCPSLNSSFFTVSFPVWTENAKLNDVYMFLFDEFLLITKVKRNKKVQYIKGFVSNCSVSNCLGNVIAHQCTLLGYERLVFWGWEQIFENFWKLILEYYITGFIDISNLNGVCCVEVCSWGDVSCSHCSWPGAGAVTARGLHLHCAGSTHLTRPPADQEHRPV